MNPRARSEERGMSLDVSLNDGEPYLGGSGIFVREDGRRREISRAEWDEKFPGSEPVVATVERGEIYSANITHNLGKMADAAGLYGPLWRPEEANITKASELVPLLEKGLERLRADPEGFKQHNPSNGWGDYEGLVQFVSEYLEACKANPDFTVQVWR
jgi:hypothetical protein